MTAYRRHFIRLNMLLVGAVLLLALALTGVYVMRNEYANMRQTMLETLEPFRGGKRLLFLYAGRAAGGGRPRQGGGAPAAAAPGKRPGNGPRLQPLHHRIF